MKWNEPPERQKLAGQTKCVPTTSELSDSKFNTHSTSVEELKKCRENEVELWAESQKLGGGGSPVSRQSMQG